MKAEYVDVHFNADGTEILGAPKTIQLPFRRASVRAIVVRRMDGALLGTLHHLGGSYALPGGAIDDSESAAEAIQRELAEENITLIGSDAGWEERIFVDYFAGYYELAVWYLFIVDDAEILPSHETVETSWLAQDERVWYPGMRPSFYWRCTLLPQNWPCLILNGLKNEIKLVGCRVVPPRLN